jgi:hypothetical protein
MQYTKDRIYFWDLAVDSCTLFLSVEFEDTVLPLSSAAMALPPAAIRVDWGVLLTAVVRYAPSLLESFIKMGPQGALSATKLLRPFSEIIDSLDIWRVWKARA